MSNKIKTGSLMFGKNYSNEFINWLTKELLNNNFKLSNKKELDFVQNVLEKYIFEFDSNKNRQLILNEILTCPELLKRTRKEKIRQLKIKEQIQKQFDLYGTKNEI